MGLVKGLEIYCHLHRPRARREAHHFRWRAEPHERRHYWKSIEGESD